MTGAPPRTDRWRGLFNQFSGVKATLNYLAAVATDEDIPFITTIAATEDLDDESRSAVLALLSAMEGETDALAALAPSKYTENVDKIIDLIAAGVPTLGVEAWGRMLTGTYLRLSCLAAKEITQHADFTDRQLRDAVLLHNPDVVDAMVERAAADNAWGTRLIERLQGFDEFKFGEDELIARLTAACNSVDVLEQLSRSEQHSLVGWEALAHKDPDGRITDSRAVLDGTSEFLRAKAEPLKTGHQLLASYIGDTGRRVACDALGRASDGSAADIARVASELKRGSYVSRESALNALISMSALEKSTNDSTEWIVTAEELARVVGDMSVLDSTWAATHVDAVLSSRLADLVVPIWRASEISGLRDAARAWELSRPCTADVDLEEALYLDESPVRMTALDQLMARWDNEQLLALLDRYGNQGRQYWYNVIAALDEHLYGYETRVLGRSSYPRTPTCAPDAEIPPRSQGAD